MHHGLDLANMIFLAYPFEPIAMRRLLLVACVLTLSGTPAWAEAPNANGQTYIVKLGDSLSTIAAQKGLSLNKLIVANPQVLDPDLIQIGQQLFIPMPGVRTATPAIKVTTPPVKRPRPRLFAFVKPPDRGLPGNREGAASRGCFKAFQPTLTALVPDSNLGLTISGHPTFFWLTPEAPTQGFQLEFRLTEVNSQQLDGPVRYETSFQSHSAGITSLTLPSDLAPLSEGQTYHWYVSLICDPADRSGDVVVDGWIKRVSPEPTLTTSLQQVELVDYPAVYAEAGLWYDALKTLVALKRLAPEDVVLQERWQSFLGTVGLENLAQQPIRPLITLEPKP